MSSKTRQDLFRQGAVLLSSIPDSCLEAKLLLLRATRLEEEEFLAAPEASVSSGVERFFWRLVAMRLAGTPLSYLTGVREFWSLPFLVRPGVLIPRPETELVVERILALSSRGKETILDLGTGSGNIAVALAKELPAARIFAADISERALRTARSNAARQKTPRILFLRSDLFSAFKSMDVRFDFVAANPPYISSLEWNNLPPGVRDFEPRRALLAGETGLEVVRRLIRQSLRFLRPGGYLVFEIGSGQRNEAVSLLGKGWTEIETAWDLSGLPRVITARKA